MAEAAFGLHSVTDGFATVNMGEPGSPIPLPGGRGWEGCTLPRSRFIPSVCGVAEAAMGESARQATAHGPCNRAVTIWNTLQVNCQSPDTPVLRNTVKGDQI